MESRSCKVSFIRWVSVGEMDLANRDDERVCVSARERGACPTSSANQSAPRGEYYTRGYVGSRDSARLAGAGFARPARRANVG